MIRVFLHRPSAKRHRHCQSMEKSLVFHVSTGKMKHQAVHNNSLHKKQQPTTKIGRKRSVLASFAASFCALFLGATILQQPLEKGRHAQPRGRLVTGGLPAFSLGNLRFHTLWIFCKLRILKSHFSRVCMKSYAFFSSLWHVTKSGRPYLQISLCRNHLQWR